jgi:uncharacterized Zn finger protein (UPF0148 family)|tara:strand:- start:15 stop:293 length:279 start_codon:yes stop_codon:yes gene_type:complete
MEHKLECVKCHTKITTTGPVSCPQCGSDYMIDYTLGGKMPEEELDFLEKMEQEQAELKESLKESKRAKQEHSNQKWKVRPDPTNCGEQDNDS